MFFAWKYRICKNDMLIKIICLCTARWCIMDKIIKLQEDTHL